MFSTQALAILNKGLVDCCIFFVTYSDNLTNAAKWHAAIIIRVDKNTAQCKAVGGGGGGGGVKTAQSGEMILNAGRVAARGDV